MDSKSMKNLNFIFSVFFIPWCILHLFGSSREESHFHHHFGYGFKEKEITMFWSSIVFLTFFNILARFTHRCNYYLFGAIGMIVLCCAQIIFILAFIKTMMSGFSNADEKHLFYNRLSFILLTFPYIVFGIQSSLFCYQLNISEKTDQNKTKFQRLFLTVFFTDFEKIVLLFNLTISFCMLLNFVMLIEGSGKFEWMMLSALTPFIPTTFCFLAFISKQKIFYNGAIITWGFLAALFSSVLFVVIKNEAFNSKIATQISFLFICLINSIVGCISSISCQNENNDKNNFENPNYVSYDVTADAVVM